MNSNAPITLSAVLFVGGQSARMGTDKATLEIDGEPMWSRQLRKLRELSPQKILISARVKPAWCPADVEVVLDRPPSHGPLTGMVAVLEVVKTTHVLALAVDLPHMPSSHFKKLWSLASDGCGVVPVIENFFEPLCAIYPVESLETARRSLQEEWYALQKLLSLLSRQDLVRPYPVPGTERSFYHNMNRPDNVPTSMKSFKNKVF